MIRLNLPAGARWIDLAPCLGVEPVLEDRWRQVPAEAARIEHKHLLTLESGISRTTRPTRWHDTSRSL